jgi:hypothetical protein
MAPSQVVVTKHMAGLKEFLPARGSSLGIERVSSCQLIGLGGQESLAHSC